MANIVSVKPILLDPVFYQGQPYLTSQYFHRQYVEHSPHGGQYNRLDSFMRLLRSIHSYTDHIELGNILELTWTALKQGETSVCVSFKPLFEATGYNQIVLFNDLALAAITPHIKARRKARQSTYLYAVKEEKTSYVKLGITRDYGKRLWVLQNGNPSRLYFLALWDIRKEARLIEKSLHTYFQAARVHHEWFSFSKANERELFRILKPYPRVLVPEIRQDIPPCIVAYPAQQLSFL